MDLMPDPEPPKTPVGFRRLRLCMGSLLRSGCQESGTKGAPSRERACGPVERLEEVKEGQR